MERPRVVLADDHRAVLEVVTGLLAPHFKVVGAARDRLDALRLISALRPDAAVLDLAMPGLGGLAVAARSPSGRRRTPADRRDRPRLRRARPGVGPAPRRRSASTIRRGAGRSHGPSCGAGPPPR